MRIRIRTSSSPEAARNKSGSRNWWRHSASKGSVFLLGFVRDIDTKLAAFDLFLHTSQSEALGLVILEAGCASLPTVATNVGGIPEIIENGVSGILVPPLSPSKAADAIEELITDPERAQRLGSALHTRVTEYFTEETMLVKTFALYQ